MKEPEKKKLQVVKKDDGKILQRLNTLTQRLEAMKVNPNRKEKVSRPLTQNVKAREQISQQRQIRAPVFRSPDSGLIAAQSSISGDPMSNMDHIQAAMELRNVGPEAIKSNQYLEALLDPETSGRDVGVPDSYPEPTYRYQSVFDLEFGPQDFSSDGLLPIVICPDMTAHCFIPSSLEKGEKYNFISARSISGDLLLDTNLMDPATGDALNTELRRVLIDGNVATNNADIENPLGFWWNGTLWAAQSIFNNLNVGVPFPLNCARQNKASLPFADDTALSMWVVGTDDTQAGPKWLFPSLYADGAGVNHVGFPFYLGAGPNSFDYITFKVRARYQQPVGGTGFAGALLTVNGYSSALGSITVGASTFGPITGAADPSALSGNVWYTADFYYSGPMSYSSVASSGRYMADEVIITIFSADSDTEPIVASPLAYEIDEFSFSIQPNNLITVNQCGSGTNLGFPSAGYCMAPVPIPQIAQFNDGVATGSRIVSMSGWATYDGSTLQDSGLAYGAYVNDRRPPADRDHSYFSTNGLTSMGGVYRGRLPLGAYGLWKPEQDQDLKFRPLDTMWAFSRPYLLFMMEQTNVQGQTIVLRTVANWEIKTLSPLLRGGLRASVIDPDQISNVFKVLGGFPLVMSNDSHMDSIKNFLGNVWGGIKAVGKGAYGGIVRPLLGKLGNSSNQTESFLGKAGVGLGDFITSIL